MSTEPKKLALLRIWQILRQHSDYDHPLKQEDIINYLDAKAIVEILADYKNELEKEA